MKDKIVKPSALTFDEAKLRRALPFELQKTSLPGVFTIPAPPTGFDLRTATQAELRRAGILFNRSAVDANPAARALWDRMTSHKFSPESHIVPEFGPPRRRTHRPHRPPRLPDSGGDNTTWAGAVIPTGQWTGVLGVWTIPTLSAPPQPPIMENENFTGWWMSTWVGLDGYAPDNSNDLLQIGIDQTLDVNGVASAWAWYEWWLESPPPNPPSYVNITPIMNFQVAPGDTVFASVAYIGTMAGQVSLFNERTGQWFPLVLAPPPTADFNGSSAEWIVEVPGGGEGYYSLPKFTPVTFAGALACNCASDLANPIISGPSNGVQLNLWTADESTVLTSTATTDDTVTITFTG